MADLPLTVNPRLWVETSEYEGRLYLSYNPQTEPGRIGAWAVDVGDWISISKADISRCSDESKYWIDGYLRGNEPSPRDVFGPSIEDADEADPRLARYKQMIADFHETGSWNSFQSWRYLIPFPPGARVPKYVWTVRSGEVWNWNGEAWELATPQPERFVDFLIGTQCHQDDGHDEELVTTAHSVCMRCGYTQEDFVPSGFSSETWERAMYTHVPEIPGTA